VVVGDSFVDLDVEGSATRLCPDAPVPVVDLERRWHRPGGAGLAAWLAARTGADVVLVTALGHDEAAGALTELLAGRVQICPLPLAGRTITKTRVAASDVPLLRLDTGGGQPAGGPLPPAVRRVLAHAGAILVSDYGSGITELPELREHLESAARRIPVVWDPHPHGAPPVPGCRLVTPNAAEARAASGTPEQGRQGRRLCSTWQADAVAITVGARGAILTSAQSEHTTIVPVPADSAAVAGHVPVRSRLDTCGAGDEFAATVTAELLAGHDAQTAVRAGVARATEFVRTGAAAAVSTLLPEPWSSSGLAPSGTAGGDAYAFADRLRAAGGRLVATGGCFDLLHRGHTDLLAAARALGDGLVVCLNSDDSVRRAKGADRPLVAQEDRASVITALAAVDAVLIFDEDTPAAVLESLQPDVWVKGSDYADRPMPEADVVQRHGGRVVLLPVVAGYSTTTLVSTAGRLAAVPDASPDDDLLDRPTPHPKSEVS
jgi:D-beta-D-heptose 7-phosphate kinase / D-beta-D-heptose 1-phosphate adenosyltransferase